MHMLGGRKIHGHANLVEHTPTFNLHGGPPLGRCPKFFQPTLRRRRPARRCIGPGVRAATTTTSTVERRAADVAVLGSSCTALASAYSLARRGKKVVLLPDLGLTAPVALPEVYRPLHLVHPQADMVSLVAEAAAYWRGLQAQASGSGLQLLADCRSLDLGRVRGGGSAGELLGRMQDACKAAGVRLGSLRGEELGALFPALRLPGGVSGLLQPDGGVLNSSAASRLLTSLAERHGVLVRERLVLRGWRDAGSHFVVRASSPMLPEAVSVFEVEQLLVAPEVWPQQVLAMFGADADLQVAQGSFVRCAAAAELSGLPLWRSIGGLAGDGLAEEHQPGPGPVSLGFPARLAGPGSSTASMKLVLGELPGGVLADPWAWRPGSPDRLGLSGAHRTAGTLLRGVGPISLSQPAAPPLPDSTQAGPAARASAQGSSWGDVALHTATPDGWPVVGFLPGLEPGRLLFTATASCVLPPQASAVAAKENNTADTRANTRSGTRAASPRAAQPTVQAVDGDLMPGSSHPTSAATSRDTEGLLLDGRPLLLDGYQLSPLLAKISVDLLCGAARPQEVDVDRVGLGRVALAARAREDPGFDPWDGLAWWQGGEAFRSKGDDDDEARERAEARARGAQMLGADAGGDAEREQEEAARRAGRGPKVFL